MFVILFKLKGAVRAHTFGPYNDYLEAEDAITKLPVSRDCEYRYIDECREDVEDYDVSDDGVMDFDDENIYNDAGIRQSIEEDRK